MICACDLLDDLKLLYLSAGVIRERGSSLAAGGLVIEDVYKCVHAYLCVKGAA